MFSPVARLAPWVIVLGAGALLGCEAENVCERPDRDPRCVDASPLDAAPPDANQDSSQAPDGGPCDRCPSDRPMCVGEQCVECAEDEDCIQAERPRCGEDGSCTGCNDLAQCARFDSSPFCASTGACVECLSSDTSLCEANHPCTAAFRCSGFEADSVAECNPCDASAVCRGRSFCVPMRFDGGGGATEVGAYCLVDAGGGARCERPTTRRLTDALTIEGELAGPVSVCAPRATTCDALASYGDACDVTVDTCGVAGLLDGICRDVDRFEGTECSLSCEDDDDCPRGIAFPIFCGEDGFCRE